MRRMQSWPLYVWLFTLYPILFLFSFNTANVYLGGVYLVLGIGLGVVTISFTALHAVTKDAHRAGMLLVILLASFFTYGHVYYLLQATFGFPVLTAWLLPLYLILTAIALFMVLRVKKASPVFARSAPYLNLLSGALVLITLPSIVRYAYYAITQSEHPTPAEIQQADPLLNSPDHPDIYYIILDGYPSNRKLLRDHDYDNMHFTNGLEERGFFVAGDSKSNYPITLLSLASSLNMRYLDDQDATASKAYPKPINYLREIVANSTVSEVLQAQGYTYAYMISGCLSPSRTADVNIDFFSTGPKFFKSTGEVPRWSYYQRSFAAFLLDTTLVRNLVGTIDLPMVEEATRYECGDPARILATFEETERIAQMPEATFTFVHILKPHNPVSFDREGNILEVSSEEIELHRSDYFFDQLEFLNERVLRMVDAIQANSSTPPIIIIQGDHGSNLGQLYGHGGPHFEILNAYHFPEKPDCLRDPAVVPVNSFRVLFNCYLDGEYPLLEARYYTTPSTYDDPFDLLEVNIAEWQAQQEQ